MCRSVVTSAARVVSDTDPSDVRAMSTRTTRLMLPPGMELEGERVTDNIEEEPRNDTEYECDSCGDDDRET